MTAWKNRARLGVATAVAAVAGVTAIGSYAMADGGSDAPVATGPVEQLVTDSQLVQSVVADGKLGLNPDAARRVDMSAAPKGLTRKFAIIPAAKQPCLFVAGGQTVQPGLVEGDGLSCGDGTAPTVASTSDGTIGVAPGVERVTLELADGSSSTVDVDSQGVWFAPPDAVRAKVPYEGKVSTVDLGGPPQG